MNKQVGECEALLRRVQRLERQNRVGKILGGFLFLALLVLLLGAAEEKKPRSLEAEQFVLRSADGKKRASLTVEEEGPSFQLFDERERPRLMIRVIKDLAGILVLDAKQNRRLELTTNDEGPSVKLSDDTEAVRLSLNVLKDKQFVSISNQRGVPQTQWGSFSDRSTLDFYRRGKNRLQLRVDEEEARVLLGNEKGKGRISLDVKENGAGIGLADDDGQISSLISVTKAGTELRLSDNRLRPRIRLRAFEKGPLLDLLDPKGTSIFSKP